MKIIGKLGLISLFYLPMSFGQPSTNILIYRAYTHNNVLNPHLLIAQRYIGKCWTRSHANQARTDAWRCRASNMILDPCFEDTTSLACVISPWSHKAAILEIDTPLYKGPAPHHKINIKGSHPWAIELQNGLRCTYLTGASTVLNNVRINYSCESYRYNIIGKIDRSYSLWQANLYDAHKQMVTKIGIKTAWF